MEKFGNDFGAAAGGDRRGGGRGRGHFRGGRGDFRGGARGGNRGKSYHSGEGRYLFNFSSVVVFEKIEKKNKEVFFQKSSKDCFSKISIVGRFPERSGYGDYHGKREYSRGGGHHNRGGYQSGRGGGGNRGGYRGRSEPPRGGGAKFQSRRQQANSDSGSDWGEKGNANDEWAAEKWEEKKQTTNRRNRVDSLGWDEPESLNPGWNEKPKQQAPKAATRKSLFSSFVKVLHAWISNFQVFFTVSNL